MNIKSNKGITLVALAVTVAILAILAYTCVSIGVNLTGTAKFTNVETYMLLIRSKCETVVNAYAIGEKEENELYGTLQSSGDMAGLYQLSQTELNAMGVKEAKAPDYYVHEKDSEGKVIGVQDVIYEPGVENSGEMYHKLTEMLKVED